MQPLASSLDHSPCEGRQHGLAIGVAQGFAARPFRVGHHAKHIALWVAHPSNVVHGAIWIVLIADAPVWTTIAEQNLVAVFDGVQARIVYRVVSFSVSNGDAQRLTIRQGCGQGRHQRFRPQQDVSANELSAFVVAQCTRKQACLTQHLESIAHTEHQTSSARVGHHLFHDGREACNRTAPEVISVAESPREDHQVDPFQVAIFVPEPLHMEPEFRAEGVFHVVVAIGPWEGDDADFHASEVRNP